MPDPTVGIKLNLNTASLKPAIAAIKSQLSGLGKAFTFGDVIDKSIYRFHQLRDAIKGAVNLFRSAPVGGASIVWTRPINQIADAFKVKLVSSIKSAVREMQIFYLQAKIGALSGLLSGLRGLQSGLNAAYHSFGTVNRAMVSLRRVAASLSQSFRSIRINPGALFGGIGGIAGGIGGIGRGAGSGITALASGLMTVGRTAAPLAIGAISKLGSVVARVPGMFFSAARSVFDFTFSLKGMVLAAATSGIGALIVGAAKTADAFQRSAWKFDTVFVGIEAEANKVAQDIAGIFKVNVASIQSQMSRSADVIKPLGMDQKTVLEITRNFAMLSQAAADWSEGRYDAERASTALMKALTGEKEMLKEFGVVITDQEVWNEIKAQGKEVNRLNFAIAIYNKILERTPDMQRAAFGRINELSGRISQFREAIKSAFAGFGEFIRPAINEMFGLFGSIGRKIAELLQSDTPVLERWREIFRDIADSLKEMANWIDSITIESLAGDVKLLQNAFSEIAKGFVNMLGRAFVALGKLIAVNVGPAIASAVRFGIERAKDVTGVNANKARAILRHQSILSSGMELSGKEKALGSFLTDRWGYTGPTKQEVNWAMGFEGRSTETSESVMQELINSLDELNKGIGNAADIVNPRNQPVRPNWGKTNFGAFGPYSGAASIFGGMVKGPSFGGGMGLVGPTTDPTKDPAFISRRNNLDIQRRTMLLNMKKTWERAEKLSGVSLDEDTRAQLLEGTMSPEQVFGKGFERRGTGRTGSMQGISEAYKNLLTRAAGKPDNTLENILTELELQNEKADALAKTRDGLLQKILDKLAPATQQELNLDMSFGN